MSSKKKNDDHLKFTPQEETEILEQVKQKCVEDDIDINDTEKRNKIDEDIRRSFKEKKEYQDMKVQSM